MAKKLKPWESFEEDVSELFSGYRQSGSGNGLIQKGDVKSDSFLIECKETSKPAYRLSRKTWDKIAEEALNLARIPVFCCRSQAGDFIVMAEIDAGDALWGKDAELSWVGVNEGTEVVDRGSSKTVSIDEPFKCVLTGERSDVCLVGYRLPSVEDVRWM